jgi:Na+/H+ antiporter NhaD/arsenite permease-like protein
MDISTAAAVIFGVTYCGVALGGLPRLAIDRTGIAMLGALAMVVFGVLTPGQALGSVNLGTLLLLYGLMIVSAQLRLGGFYTWLAVRLSRFRGGPGMFLLVLMATGGALAAVLANDIICLAFTPVLAAALRRRGLNPVPFLLGLAMGTNLGSAATIIGNPQSMLIGQTAGLSFREFLFWCGPPSAVCLALTYVVLRLVYRGRFSADAPADVLNGGNRPGFDRWQTAKGLLAATAVVALLFSPLPREWSVVTVAGVLLLSRRMHTRSILGLVDWHLITLFCGLFVVVAGFNSTGLPQEFLAYLERRGVPLSNPFVLSLSAVALSNMVSNVPATVLLAPHMPQGSPVAWYVLSLATTYAGNLFTIGSMANLIVIEQARLEGVRISFREYARSGIPVTAVNLLVLAGWIALRGG